MSFFGGKAFKLPPPPGPLINWDEVRAKREEEIRRRVTEGSAVGRAQTILGTEFEDLANSQAGGLISAPKASSKILGG